MRIFGLARALARAHDLHVLALRRSSTTDAQAAELEEAIEGPVELFEGSGRREGWGRALRRGVPPWVAEQHSPALQRRALELAPGMDAVTILDDYAAIYAPALAAGGPVVCDKHNVSGFSAAAPLPADSSPRERARRAVAIHLSRRFERHHLAPASAVVVSSNDEAERLSSLYGLRAAATVPSAVDVPEETVEPGGQRAIGWLGSHEYDVNVEGLVRFVEEGWDELGRAGLRLLVAGGSPPPQVLELKRHPGVEILGYVERLDELFSQLGAAVVPLWRGAGVKLKTLTFMAAGVPVVGTPVAVEGIEAQDGRHCLVAEEPARLAEAARSLVDDVSAARRIGAAGRRLVAESYSWPAVGSRFREVVERVAVART